MPKRWPLEAWQSRVFATWAIFPFLHSFIGRRGSTNQRGFHLDWPEGSRAEKSLAGLGWAGLQWPGACWWDIVWAKDFYLDPFLGNFLPWPLTLVPRTGLFCAYRHTHTHTRTQATQILCVILGVCPETKI